MKAAAARQAPEPIRRIAAIIVNWNRADLTLKAIHSIQGSVQSIYVLDNNSGDDDFAVLQAESQGVATNLIRATANLGYAAGNNLAARAALMDGCDALLIMNNDAYAEPGAVDALARHLEVHPEVGIAMPTVVSLCGSSVLHGRCTLNRRFATPGWEGPGLRPDDMPDQPAPTDYASGEAFLCRITVVEQCGLFDERFFCYYEDVDLSIRVAWAGWRLDYVPYARFRHELG